MIKPKCHIILIYHQTLFQFQDELLVHWGKKEWAVKPRDSHLLYEEAIKELNLWVKQDGNSLNRSEE